MKGCDATTSFNVAAVGYVVMSWDQHNQYEQGIVMILATIEQAYRYADCHHRLSRGFEFLQTTKLEELADGKHEIDGTRLFALVAHDQGRGRDGAILEVHRKYIDIQYVISGNELLGWRPLTNCKAVKQAYDFETDLAFFL
jgi:YhcH/YjgK/YiaL family protein